MCLFVEKNDKVKTTDKKMVVYKVIKKRDYKKKFFNKYESPYQSFKIKWHKILIEEDKDVCQRKPNLIKDVFPTEFIVEIGFHSFYNKKEAKKMIDEFILTDNTEYYKLAKCIIPKGSKIIEGKWHNFGVTMNSIVSNKIKYVKIIN